ncbi:AIM4 (YBR194W) [Zygosaccharomyces parabailii]|nr:AIM4 (YBR194W) [Zygosaccharomyces parabailii]
MSEKSTNPALGSRSIFYDPEWNPEGKAPPGFKNVPYNPSTFTRKPGSLPSHTLGLDIKPPISGNKK